MIYITAIKKSEAGEIVYYNIFDTYSESAQWVSPIILRKLIKNTEIQVVNAKLENSELIIKEWANKIRVISPKSNGREITTKHSGAEYILLARKDKLYKLVNHSGRIHSFDKIEPTVVEKNIANCKFTKVDGIITIESTDTYESTEDEEFKKLIETKYTNFIAKTTMLGYGDLAFEYEIENSTVKVKKYTGTSKDIILPPFITAIMRNAFRNKGIETLEFNEGLKVIGDGAFVVNRLQRVEIPESVELIWSSAFRNNIKLLEELGGFNTSRFKIRNKKTLIID